MPLRTFVSFEASFASRSQPPGAEIAQFVSTVLSEDRVLHDEPVEREGWAWTIQLQQDFTHVEIVIGELQARPDHWLITMDGHFSLARGLAIGSNADEERDEALQPICFALDRALKHDPRFRDVRWYTPEAFDSNHEGDWVESP